MRASCLTSFYTSSCLSIFSFTLPSFTYTLTPLCPVTTYPSPHRIPLYLFLIQLSHCGTLFFYLLFVFFFLFFLLLFCLLLLLHLFRAGKFCFSSSLCNLPLYPPSSQLVVSNVLHPSQLPVVKGHNLWYLVNGWMCRDTR